MYGIGYWLSRHARLHPYRVALATPDRRITSDEPNRDANQLAHALRSQGIGEGQRIGILSSLTATSPARVRLLSPGGHGELHALLLNGRLQP